MFTNDNDPTYGDDFQSESALGYVSDIEYILTDPQDLDTMPELLQDQD